MKAAVFYGPRDLRIEDVEEPEIGPGDILVKVEACGICGSDLHGYKKGSMTRPGWIMGHELSGIVAGVGSNVRDIKVGDRVVPNIRWTLMRRNIKGCGECYWCKKGLDLWCDRGLHRPCGKCQYCQAGQFWLCTELCRYQDIGYGRNGGFAEYVRMADAVLGETVYRLPDSLSFEDGALLEPLAGCVDWVSLAEPKSGEVAVVLGAGTIGLCAMQVLKTTVARVIISDVSSRRLALAGELGADVVVDAGKEDVVQKVVEITGTGRSFTGRAGARADIAMECAGVPATLIQAIEVVRTGGRVVLVSLFEEAVSIEPNRIIHKPIKLISSFEQSRTDTDELAAAIELISSGKARGEALVSHHFSLGQINEAFETQLRAGESVKVVVHP